MLPLFLQAAPAPLLAGPASAHQPEADASEAQRTAAGPAALPPMSPPDPSGSAGPGEDQLTSFISTLPADQGIIAVAVQLVHSLVSSTLVAQSQQLSAALLDLAALLPGKPLHDFSIHACRDEVWQSAACDAQSMPLLGQVRAVAL